MAEVIGMNRMGPARKKLKWKKDPYGSSYTAEYKGTRYAVVWQYKNQWVLRVNNYTTPHVFKNAAAAKRYAAGGEILDVGKSNEKSERARLRAALKDSR